MKFSNYTGIFHCHECDDTVSKMRFWYETKEITWKCDEGHISSVDLNRKRRARG